MKLPDASVCLHVEGAQNRHDFDRGIPRYVVEHAKAIHATAPESIHSVLLNPALPLTGNLDWLLGTGLVKWGTPDPRVAGGRRRRPLIYHVMCPFFGSSLDEIWPAWARESSVATVLTLYDLIPMLFPEHYLGEPRQSAWYEARLNLVRHADQVLAISQATASDAIEHLGIDADRVQVIHAGAGDDFAQMYQSGDAAWSALGPRFPALRPGFVLYVGGYEFRKNLEGLIDGYGRLAPELRAAHQLVITCRLNGDQAASLRARGAQAGLAPWELVLTGYVTDTELGALYHACTLFVFASLYEGSGLPVLEAMSCGAPVAASNNSSLPELLGSLEATFDPSDPTSIAACLAETVGSPATLERLRARSRARSVEYTWARVARLSVEAYERAVARRSRTSSRRPRVALVTPWPPDHSGVAGYNERLAAELTTHVDIDVVVAQPGERPLIAGNGVRVVAASNFHAARTLRQYDRVVYCMGNSVHHVHVLDLLREHPGTVVLHDVRLTGFYGSIAGRERPDDPAGWLAEQIRAGYGGRHGLELADRHPPDWSEQHALGLYMTQEVQSLADAVFVHSRFASDVLALDGGLLERRVRVGILPFGMPCAARASRGPAAVAPVIISLGVVHEVKGLAPLIRGFALFAVGRPGARLVIAGPADPHDRERWNAYIGEHAAEADIQLTGHVSAARYAALIDAADVAVQLRLASNGEASATVADCLSAGLPTLVSDVGWARELPDGAVARIRAGATPLELAVQLERLVSDVPLRTSLSACGLEYARRNSFAEVARAYVAALELD